MRRLAPEDLARLQEALSRSQTGSSDYDLNPGMNLPEGRKLRPAAVLIGLSEGTGGAELWLTKRPSLLRPHPGQIAFPGGKLDDTDPTPEHAALREAEEEIGLPRGLVTPLARLPEHETVTGYAITPVLARIEGDFSPRAEAGEVAEVFRVPFTHVADPARYRIEKRLWQGQWRSYYTVPWGPYYIWGATARILYGLANRLRP